jgi:hypothetical protein
MFVTVVDEKADTESPGILVEYTHDGTRGTVLVLNAEARTVTFEPRIPNGPTNAYVDDDGKHGIYFQPGDPSNFPTDPENPDAEIPDDGDDEDQAATEDITW